VSSQTPNRRPGHGRSNRPSQRAAGPGLGPPGRTGNTEDGESSNRQIGRSDNGT